MGAGKPVQRTAGSASMFPGEAPQTPLPPALEEAGFRRSEITNQRDRTGRREEIYRNLQAAEAQGRAGERVAPGGAVERGASAFGAAFGGAGQGPARSGVVFGPGRSTRMPEPGTPEYNQLIQRARQSQTR